MAFFVLVFFFVYFSCFGGFWCGVWVFFGGGGGGHLDSIIVKDL